MCINYPDEMSHVVRLHQLVGAHLLHFERLDAMFCAAVVMQAMERVHVIYCFNYLHIQ